jgi:hypothetical protein
MWAELLYVAVMMEIFIAGKMYWYLPTGHGLHPDSNRDRASKEQ